MKNDFVNQVLFSLKASQIKYIPFKLLIWYCNNSFAPHVTLIHIFGGKSN